MKIISSKLPGVSHGWWIKDGRIIDIATQSHGEYVKNHKELFGIKEEKEVVEFCKKLNINAKESSDPSLYYQYVIRNSIAVKAQSTSNSFEIEGTRNSIENNRNIIEDLVFSTRANNFLYTVVNPTSYQNDQHELIGSNLEEFLEFLSNPTIIINRNS